MYGYFAEQWLENSIFKRDMWWIVIKEDIEQIILLKGRTLNKIKNLVKEAKYSDLLFYRDNYYLLNMESKKKKST